MLLVQTMEKLTSMKCLGMVKALEEQQRLPEVSGLSFEERLSIIVDREDIERKNRRYITRIKSAKLRYPTAMIEDIDYKADRKLEKSVILSFGSCNWIREHLNIILTGPSGAGKGFIACAIAQRACMEGFSVYFQRVSRLIDCLALSRADGTYTKFFQSLFRYDVLILDDFGIPLTENARRDIMEIVEDRYNTRSTIITSQLPVNHWPEVIGDPSIADGIMDRIVHNAHKIEMEGPSQRELRSPLNKRGK